MPTSTSRVIPVAPSPARPACAVGPLFLDVIMTGLDHAPRPGEEQWVRDCAMMPGGCANQAVALARLGLPVLLRSSLGQDRAGALVRTMLEEEGIDLSACESTDRQNVTVSLAFDGDRAMTTVGSDAAPSLEGLGVVPSVLVTDLRAVAANESVVRDWRSGNAPTAVVGDVGWDDTGRWAPTDLQPLEHVDVFAPQQGRGPALHPHRDPHRGGPHPRPARPSRCRHLWRRRRRRLQRGRGDPPAGHASAPGRHHRRRRLLHCRTRPGPRRRRVTARRPHPRLPHRQPHRRPPRRLRRRSHPRGGPPPRRLPRSPRGLRPQRPRPPDRTPVKPPTPPRRSR